MAVPFGYDYISGDLEADLLAWIQGVDIAQDMLSVSVWLHKYGLSIWVWRVPQPEKLIYGAEAYTYGTRKPLRLEQSHYQMKFIRRSTRFTLISAH
jgi:hypothetical protein